MKTITLIAASILIMMSCTQKTEINECPTQLDSADENNCICKYLSRKNIHEQKLKSKNGLILMKPKIKIY